MSRSKEEFEPSGERVRLYTCGPTVYNYTQIGNLRAYVFCDTLRRALELNWKVKHVMNVTDVGHLTSDADEGDDKLESGAKREGKSVWDVAKHYTEAFLDDAQKLNLLPPSQLAKATDFIPQQIDLISRLFDGGFVYQTTQAIYFDVTKSPGYGKLSGQLLSDKREGAREEVVTDTEKRHPFDFAVWFFTTGHFADHTMRWDSPWGEGFPGWHLECSAIAHELLGDELDIHTGGVDHIGTHHTNEIAQSEAAYGKPLSHFWLHNEFLMVDGGKMSKSRHNFYTLREVEERGFSPLALRLLYLQAHYRTQQNFTWEALGAASNLLVSLNAFADRQFQEDGDAGEDLITKAKMAILASLDDDLNTPEALAELNRLIDSLDGLSLDDKALQTFLEFIDSVFGLELTTRKDIDDDIKSQIRTREAARQANDYDTADRIRAELIELDVEVGDTPLGPRWRRTKP